MTAVLRMTRDAERALAVSKQFAKTENLDELAAALVGLHASRHSGPYVVAYSRMGRDADGTHGRNPGSGGLVQHRSVRGTLHSMPATLASVAHVATVEQRVATSRRRLARSGWMRSEIDRSVPRILDGVREAGDVGIDESAVVGRDGPVLRHLWDLGVITAYDATGTPRRKGRCFVATSDVCGWHEGTEVESRADLARRYFRRYGPASAGDLGWWSGWRGERTARVLARLKEELLEVTVEGLPGPLYLHCADEEAARDPPHLTSDAAHVVAYEDPAVKAYFATRERYLDGAPARSLFWHAGESLACVFVAGRVAAVWSSTPFGSPPALCAVRPMGRQQKAAVDVCIEQLRTWLGSWGR